MKIPITTPFFSKTEKEAIVKPLESGWVVQGPNVHEFEGEVARYTGANFARAVNSCTSALHLSLICAGVSPGDEVILPSFTYVATANVVEYINAVPVLVDIDPQTFNIDPIELRKTVTAKTRAIIPVHLFGLSADMDVVMDIAEKNNIAVVEDAACSLGTLYKGKHVGTFGIGNFSFHPRKPISTGEGGIITTSSKEIADKLSSLRSHGESVSDLERHKKGAFAMPDHSMLGYNYRMTDFQGALGVEQMKKLDEVLRKRISRAEKYTFALRNLKGIVPPHVPEGYKHTYQSYVVLVTNDCPLSRDELALQLTDRGISVRQGTQAVHTLGYYIDKYGFREQDFPVSLRASRQSLTLPLYPQMTEEEQDYVIENLRDLIEYEA